MVKPLDPKAFADVARDAYGISMVLAQACFIAWGPRSALTLEIMGMLERIHHDGALGEPTMKTLRHTLRALQKEERPRRPR